MILWPSRKSSCQTGLNPVMGILARLQKSRSSHPRQAVFITHTNTFFKIHIIHNDNRDHPLVLKNMARFILTTKHLYVGNISFVQYLK